MHILHLPLLFLTRTGLEIHLGYWTSLMNPMRNNLLTSSLVAFARSSFIFLLRWITGRTDESMLSECIAIDRDTPLRSPDDQAKTSDDDDSSPSNALSLLPGSPVNNSLSRPG